MILPREPQTADDVAGHYDELDRVYREIWGEHVHHGYWRTGRESAADAVVALADMVGDWLNPRAGDVLCDIGCGYGATAARLAATRGVSVTGLTLSAEQAAVGHARPGALTILRRDWLANGLDDATFDHAYAIESSEHMVDKQRFFDEAARVLRPGGRLVICAWLAASRPAGWEMRHLLEPICREGRLPSMGTREDYAAMAAAAGFAERGFEDISRQVRRTWSICSARLARRLATDRSLRRLVFGRATKNRSFLFSLPRLMLAYRIGAMRYGVFVFERG